MRLILCGTHWDDVLSVHVVASNMDTDFELPVFGSVCACLEVGYCTTSARFDIEADQEACNQNVSCHHDAQVRNSH